MKNLIRGKFFNKALSIGLCQRLNQTPEPLTLPYTQEKNHPSKQADLNEKTQPRHSPLPSARWCSHHCVHCQGSAFTGRTAILKVKAKPHSRRKVKSFMRTPLGCGRLAALTWSSCSCMFRFLTCLSKCSTLLSASCSAVVDLSTSSCTHAQCSAQFNAFLAAWFSAQLHATYLVCEKETICTHELHEHHSALRIQTNTGHS